MANSHKNYKHWWSKKIFTSPCYDVVIKDISLDIVRYLKHILRFLIQSSIYEEMPSFWTLQMSYSINGWSTKYIYIFRWNLDSYKIVFSLIPIGGYVLVSLVNANFATGFINPWFQKVSTSARYFSLLDVGVVLYKKSIFYYFFFPDFDSRKWITITSSLYSGIWKPLWHL